MPHWNTCARFQVFPLASSTWTGDNIQLMNINERDVIMRSPSLCFLITFLGVLHALYGAALFFLREFTQLSPVLTPLLFEDPYLGYHMAQQILGQSAPWRRRTPLDSGHLAATGGTGPPCCPGGWTPRRRDTASHGHRLSGWDRGNYTACYIHLTKNACLYKFSNFAFIANKLGCFFVLNINQFAVNIVRNL